MSRPAKYSEDKILDASLELFAEKGERGVNMAAVARKLGAPSGSIYYRFTSRDEMLASLWLREVERFQSGFVAALDGPDVAKAVEDATLYVVEWARHHPAEGRLLLLHRRRDLMRSDWPDSVAARANQVTGALNRALAAVARRMPKESRPDRPLLVFALTGIPYAAVRDSLASGRAIPPSFDSAVVAAVRGALNL